MPLSSKVIGIWDSMGRGGNKWDSAERRGSESDLPEQPPPIDINWSIQQLHPLPSPHLPSPHFRRLKERGRAKEANSFIVRKSLSFAMPFLSLILSQDYNVWRIAFSFKGSESFGEEFDRRWRARAFNTRSLPPSIPKAETTAWLVKRI